MSVHIDRIALLELDVDTRLLDLWFETAGVEEWSPRLVGEFMRSAYVRGYEAALIERKRGRLYSDNGYETPRRAS